MTDLSLLYCLWSHHSAVSSPYKAPCPNNCQATSSLTKQIDKNTSPPSVASYNSSLKTKMSLECKQFQTILIFKLFKELEILDLPLNHFHCSLLHASSYKVFRNSLDMLWMIVPWFKTKKVHNMNMSLKWLIVRPSIWIFEKKKKKIIAQRPFTLHK